jgi:hypothetical protein
MGADAVSRKKGFIFMPHAQIPYIERVIFLELGISTLGRYCFSVFLLLLRVSYIYIYILKIIFPISPPIIIKIKLIAPNIKNPFLYINL